MSALKELARQQVGSGAPAPERAAGLLREAILSGLLKPGAAIRQDRVAAELSVSKIPLREALSRLEAEGLVCFQRNRGAVVAPLSLAEMRQVFELRRLLECHAIARSLPGLKAADLARAKAVIAETARAEEPAALGRLNWDFHRALLAGLGEGPLIAMIGQAHLLAERYVRLHLALSGVVPRSQREHRALLAACRAGDADKAKSLMADHLDRAVAKLEAYFKEQGLPE